MLPQFALKYRDMIKSRFAKMDQVVGGYFFLFHRKIDYRLPINGKISV